ncbi:MAG: FG-GAP-like repeat-containing protein [Prevotellaceae bacterium]|jgi:glycerophosphoryl diester phosphodiesterase|nr:FG-GAP-like repeat-containing protein [Prevotellaceae bacterium]
MKNIKPNLLNMVKAAALLCCMGVAAAAQGSRWYVKTSGAGSGASWDDALSPSDFVAKLSDGFQDGDSIYVAAGVYYSGTEKSSFMSVSKGLTIVGGFSPDVTGAGITVDYPSPCETVFSGDIDKDGKLDNDNADRVIEISATSPVTLVGITVSGGYRSGGGNDGHPGGVDVKGANVELRYCKVRGNKTESSAGGIYVNGGSLYCYKTVISDNEASNRGAGVRIQNGATLRLESCLLTGNKLAGDWGGAIQVSGDNNPVYCINTTIANNSAGQGGAAINSPGVVYIVSSTIANNVCSNAGQGHDVRCESAGKMHIYNSIITGYPDYKPNIFLNGADKSITSDGYNVLGSYGGAGSMTVAATDTVGASFSGVFGHGTLSENGGYPKTIVPAIVRTGASPSELAAYAATHSLPDNVGKDQRGFERPETAASAGAAEGSVRVEQNKIEKLLARLKSTDSSYVFVIAHRGDWRNAPENSIPAIEKAAAAGVDMVEIDIQKTKDGEFVLMHDGNVNRTTNGSGNIGDKTLAELKRLRLRYTDGVLSDETIPTLREALLACKRSEVLVNIDKGGDYLAQIMPIVNETETRSLVVLKGGNSLSSVKSMLGANLDIVYMPVLNLQSGDANGVITSFLTGFQTYAMEVQFSNEDFNPSSYTERIAAGGSRVWINSLWASLCGAHEDEKAMSDPDASWGWLLEKGATMLQTDRPRELIWYLQRKGLRDPAYILPEVRDSLANGVPTFVNVDAETFPAERLSNGSGVWGDYNNDGYLDLFCIGANDRKVSATHLYRNNGNGTFTEVTTSVKKFKEATCAWIDYNSDGNLDLIICGSDGGVSTSFTLLYKNRGAAEGYTFEEVTGTGMEHLSNESEKCYRYVAVGDYNNDGFQDVLLTGQNRSGVRRTSLYRNDGGTGKFLLQDTVLNGGALRPYSSGSVAFGDMDGDGYLDILSTGYGDAVGRYPVDMGGFKVYRNQGDGTFAQLEGFSTDEWGSFLGQCAWADVNNDGALDFIITGKHRNGSGQDINQAKLYINSGSGQFEQKRSALANLEPLNLSGMDWADVNSDGYVDLVMSGYGNTSSSKTWVYINLGDGTFYPYISAIAPVRTGAVAVADYDRDGLPDVFSCGYREGSGGGSVAELWRNSGGSDIPANTPPQPPFDLSASKDDDGYTRFSWTAPTDDYTPSAALRYNLYVADSTGKIIQMLVPADTASGFVKVGDISPALTSTSYKMKLATEAYTWGVQAVDNGKLGSPFAVPSYEESVPAAVESRHAEGISVAVYPNPAREYVTVAFEQQGVYAVSLTNVAGSVLYRTVASGASVRIDLGSCPDGVYFLTVESGRSRIVKKFLVVR